jgi:hypothetical protein
LLYAGTWAQADGYRVTSHILFHIGGTSVTSLTIQSLDLFLSFGRSRKSVAVLPACGRYCPCLSFDSAHVTCAVIFVVCFCYCWLPVLTVLPIFYDLKRDRGDFWMSLAGRVGAVSYVLFNGFYLTMVVRQVRLTDESARPQVRHMFVVLMFGRLGTDEPRTFLNL